MSLVKKAIENMTYESKKFPEEEFRILSENPTEAIPYLRAAIEKAFMEQDDLEYGYQLHFYAFFLLGQFQDREFFPQMMEFISLPEDVLNDLIGDAITSGLSDIIYNMYNGNLGLLKRMILDPAVDEFVRDGLLSVMGQLYLDGTLEKEEWQTFLREAIYDGEDLGTFFCAQIGSAICKCRFMEMLPEIRQLLGRDLIDTSVVGHYDAYLDMMFEYDWEDERFCKTPLDAAKTLRSWSMFSETNKEPLFNDEAVQNKLRELEKEWGKSEGSTIKIGRNDPCPCGSGRKYKHCCLNKKSPLDEIESMADREKWLKSYPETAVRRIEGRIYLEDYFDRESIAIDKLLYLALMPRPGFPWQRNEAEKKLREKKYLSEAFSEFTKKIEKENIKTFREYDKKYSIHYTCKEWLNVLLERLEESGDRNLYKEVHECCRKL